MNAVINQTEKELDIQEVLSWLEEDGMVTAENAKMLRMLAVSPEYQEKNALIVIA